MEWISTAKELPKNNDNVLVYNPNIEGGIEVAFYNDDDKEWQGLSDIYLNGITHWMPFPQLPKQ